MAMTLVQTITLGSDAAAIEFTSIPQTGKDLMLLINSRAANLNGKITFNSDTSAVYNYRNLFGDGQSTYTGSGTNELYLQSLAIHEPRDFNGTNNTVGIFSNGQLYISNYTGSQNKSVSLDSVIEINANESYQALVGGRWSQTSAITSITIQTTSGNVLATSSISLYIIS